MADEPLTIIRPGTPVRFTRTDITDAYVTAVQINRGEAVEYQVVWFTNGARQEAWVKGFEVEPAAGHEQTGRRAVGFAGV